ncbi:BrnA antitoxin family protein [Bradyrhizobium sp. B024]|uniref:BrnA antitoxin family protein n=1 Tax=Bradyrhizobium sp. B024 TaxID=3140247 RepID=UPI0031838168
MVSRKKVVDDPENPEWTAEDFARAKNPEAVLSPDVLALFGKRRGPQKAPKKVPVSIRLNQLVITHFKEMGRGWQSKIDETLTDIVIKGYSRKRATGGHPQRALKRKRAAR